MVDKIFCDGSSWKQIENNSICVVKYKSKGKPKKLLKVIEGERQYYSINMEYLAFIEAVKMITNDSVIYSDCQQLVMEIQGFINPINTKHLFDKAFFLLLEKTRKFKVDIEWISRTKNHAGIILEKRAKKLGAYISNSTECHIKPRRY